MRYMGSVAVPLAFPEVTSEALAKLRLAQTSVAPLSEEDRVRAVQFGHQIAPAIADDTVLSFLDVLEETHPAARGLKWRRIGYGAGLAAAAGLTVYAFAKYAKKARR